MRKSILAVAALAAAPLFAGDTGWYAGLDTTLANSNDNQLVATQYDYTQPTGNVFGRNHRLDYGSDPSIHLYGGYKNAMGDWRFSYWGYSADADKVTVRGTPNDWATDLYPYIDGHGLDDLDFNSKLKATQIDFTWGRNLVGGEKLSLDWNAGLRYWKTERDMNFMGVAYDSPGVVHSTHEGHHDSKSTGLGLTFGVSGKTVLTERVWLDSDLRMGWLFGKTDFSAVEHINHLGTIYDNRFSDKLKDATFKQCELAARVNFKIWNGLVGYAGYEFRQYDDALAVFNHDAYYSSGVQTISVSGVNFNGFVLGGRWNF